jgi:hypothetical protein
MNFKPRSKAYMVNTRQDQTRHEPRKATAPKKSIFPNVELERNMVLLDWCLWELRIGKEQTPALQITGDMLRSLGVDP